MGAVTTAAPSYTTATTNNLSLTTAGALRVDGSSVTQPVSGTFWQATQPVSGTVSVSGSVAVTGTFWQATQPVSIAATVNVSAAQSGNWTTRTVGAAGATLDFAGQNVAAPANAFLVGGEFNTTPTTITSGNASPLQLDANGNLLVNIKATVVQSTQGDTASGATDAGNPVKVGGLAKTTNPTAVTDGQRVNALFDKVGKQVCVGAVRQLKGVQTTTITTTTETTIVTAGAAGVFQDLYGLTIANTSATAVNVAIKDATAGTTRITLQIPAGDTRGFMLPVDSAIPQAAAAANWTATVSAAVSSIFITALYVSNL